MGTTEESLKDGGRNSAPTGPPTKCSGVSLSLRRRAIGLYTRDTSQAPTTQQMAHQGGFSLLASSASTSLISPVNSNLSSSASGPSELIRRLALKRLAPTSSPDAEQSGPKRRLKLPEARPRQLPIPQTQSPQPKPPVPYRQNLTPIPSLLRPHCLARDCLRKWIPACNQTAESGISGIDEPEQERIKDTMIHAWEEDT